MCGGDWGGGVGEVWGTVLGWGGGEGKCGERWGGRCGEVRVWVEVRKNVGKCGVVVRRVVGECMG